MSMVSTMITRKGFAQVCSIFRHMYKLVWCSNMLQLHTHDKHEYFPVDKYHLFHPMHPGPVQQEWSLVQWNLSVTTTSIIKFIACDLFSNVF